MNPFDKLRTSKGYIGLISVLIVAAVAVATATTVIGLGISNSRNSFVIVQSSQAKGLADACAEQALQKIRDFLPFHGNGTLTMGQGRCNFTVTTGVGQNRTIVAAGFVGTVIRRVTVTISQINPQIIMNSWVENP